MPNGKRLDVTYPLISIRGKMIRERIEKKMLEVGISQRQLAKDINIAQSSLNDFLRGRRAIPFTKLEAIFERLGL